MAPASARSLFFFVLELVGAAGGDWVEMIGAEKEDEGDAATAAAALITSESFCLFFFVEAELSDDCEGANGTSLFKYAAGVAAT